MANPYFNASYYLATNLDVLAAGYTVETAEQHYLNYGAAEALAGTNTARKPAPWFDIQYYLTSNTDLLDAGIGADTAFWHFTTYGQFEQRSPANGLTVTDAKLKAYADANEDLRTAFDITDTSDLTDAQKDALTSHFYQYGYSEDRPGSPFDSDVNPGETFTLTTGADNIVGTSGNDTINGNVDTIANGGTFNNADVIDGGAGDDTFNLTVSDNAAFANGATVKNVETLNIREVSTAFGNISLAGFSGLTTIASVGSTQNVGVINVAKAATLGLESTSKGLAVSYAANALGSMTAAQAVKVNGAIDGANAVTLTLDVDAAEKITKLSVDSTGAKSSVKIAGVAAADVALTDLTVTGSAALTLAEDTAGQEFGTLKTIDASGMTAGGLTLSLVSQGADVVGTKFTGSGADDKLTLNAAHLTAKDTLDGGAGTDNLVLNVAATTAGNSSLIATGAATGVSGFETLSVTSTSTAVSGAAANVFTVDSSAFTGVSKVLLGSNLAGDALNIIALTNLSNASTVAITANQTGVVNATFKPADIAGGADLGLTLELGAAKAAGVTAATVGVTQVANLTIKSAGTSVNTITDLTAAQNTALKTITVTGDQALKITNDLDVKGLTTLDARGLTLTKTTDSGLTLDNAITNGAAKGISIYGSNGVDTIKGSAVGDTIWGGLGADTITLGTAGKTDIISYTAAAESTSTAKDVVSVFEGARDLLKFEGISVAGTFSLQNAAFTAGGNASALIASSTLGGAQDLSIDFNGDGVSDMVISLAGVGTLTTANFEFV